MPSRIKVTDVFGRASFWQLDDVGRTYCVLVRGAVTRTFHVTTRACTREALWIAPGSMGEINRRCARERVRRVA